MTRLRSLAPYGWYVVLSVFFCAPLATDPRGLGIADWDYELVQHAVVLKSLFAYGQLPFWNLWSCGGNVLWQNPQVALLTPVYLFAPIVSLPLAIKLTVFIHYLLGAAGMHVLVTRGFGLRFQPLAIFVSSLFAFAGGITLHIAVGHSTFLPYFFLPWQLFFVLRALASGAVRYALTAAGMIALALYNGGFYIVAMSGVGFAIFAVVLAVLTRSWRPLAVVGIMLMAAAAYAAPKLIPTSLLLADPSFWDARLPSVPAPMNWPLLARAFLDPFQTLDAMYPVQSYPWHEYGNYMGSTGALLVVASFIWILTVRGDARTRGVGIALAVTSGVLFLLLLGDVGRYAPAEVIRRLPVFSGLRPPNRFSLLFTMYAAAMVGWAASSSFAKLSITREAARLWGIVFAIGAVLLIWENRRVLALGFSEPPVDADLRTFAMTPPRVVDTQMDPYAPHTPMLRAFVDGRVPWRCYEPLQLKPVAIPDAGLVVADAPLVVSDVRVTSNTVRFTVATGGAAGRVYLNQNYVRGWTSDAGRVRQESPNARAHVLVRGDRSGTYTFSFAPPGLGAGAALLAIAIATSRGVWRLTL